MMSADIDTTLYDRQIRTVGEAANKKISSSCVVIIGLSNGLAAEIGKNLCLSGVGNIYLLDEKLIQESNLETGFYYSKSK